MIFTPIFPDGPLRPDNICLSAAGPVIDGKVKFTNLSWYLDDDDICNHLTGCKVAILNSLEAIACGLAAVKKKNFPYYIRGRFKHWVILPN